jgi:RNA polymerase sigma-70 factor (ECF subfamily)
VILIWPRRRCTKPLRLAEPVAEPGNIVPGIVFPEAMGAEVIGLLALMLLQESRRAARTSPTGELILLENQDRSLWNREQIGEGVALLEKALKCGQKSRRFGAYTLQAAIAAVHAEADSVAATDWRQIVALYDRLLRIQPSPVVQLNRAVAVAMCDGPEAGLAHIDAVLKHGELANYYLAHSARADMYRRLGRPLRLGRRMRKLGR